MIGFANPFRAPSDAMARTLRDDKSRDRSFRSGLTKLLNLTLLRVGPCKDPLVIEDYAGVYLQVALAMSRNCSGQGRLAERRAIFEGSPIMSRSHGSVVAKHALF